MRLVEEVESLGDGRCFDAAADAELTEDVRYVCFGGFRADEERLRDLRVCVSACHQLEDVELAVGQAVPGLTWFPARGSRGSGGCLEVDARATSNGGDRRSEGRGGELDRCCIRRSKERCDLALRPSLGKRGFGRTQLAISAKVRKP